MKSVNLTNPEDRRRRRRYEDACAAAHAMDLLGERWALLVVRELMHGPKRFTDLKASLSGISANVLTQRLGGLEAAGVLVRYRLSPPAGSQVYDLTDWGRESEPIFQALGRWAARSPAHDPTLPLSTASIILSMGTMFDPARAGDARARIGFRIGPDEYLAEVADGAITLRRGRFDSADAIFSATAPTLAGMLYGSQPLATLEAARVLKIEGDRALAARFVTWFVLPSKVASSA